MVGDWQFVLSAEEYARLKRRDRRVIAAGELTEDEIALIAKAEVPADACNKAR